jgi:hypothetical protein
VFEIYSPTIQSTNDVCLKPLEGGLPTCLLLAPLQLSAANAFSSTQRYVAYIARNEVSRHRSLLFFVSVHSVVGALDCLGSGKCKSSQVSVHILLVNEPLLCSKERVWIEAYVEPPGIRSSQRSAAVQPNALEWNDAKFEL